MAKKMVEVLVVVGLLALLQGCGGSDDKGGATPGGAGTFSCNIAAPEHECIEYTWSTGAPPTTAWSTACTQNGGTAGTSCVRTGSVGGCRTTIASGGVSVVSTIWLFVGTVADAQATCAALTYTYVAP